MQHDVRHFVVRRRLDQTTVGLRLDGRLSRGVRCVLHFALHALPIGCTILDCQAKSAICVLKFGEKLYHHF